MEGWKRKRAEGTGRKERERRLFFSLFSKRHRVTTSRAFHSKASNPFFIFFLKLKLFLKLYGPMIQRRYYRAGGRAEEEIKHYHWVETPSTWWAAPTLAIHLKHFFRIYDEMNYDFDNGQSHSQAVSASKGRFRLVASCRRSLQWWMYHSGSRHYSPAETAAVATQR